MQEVSNYCLSLAKENPDKDYVIEIKEHREKRSNNANSYAWVLIGKISEVVQIDSLDVYRDFIERVGKYRDISIDEKAENTLVKIWSEHGKGWIANRLDFAPKDGFVILRCWYGSSVYNTKQMARFINEIINDCYHYHIETKTPDEIARLIGLWEGGN